MTSTARLVSIASKDLSAQGVFPSDIPWRRSRLGSELLEMLGLRNGFYAFEGTLHVYPSGGSATTMSLEEWNSKDLWRYEYDHLSDGLFFFAEDGVGNQFCLRDNEVCLFDAETGDLEMIAGTIDDWARRVLDDYELLTGFPLFHDWQVTHGRVPLGCRLVPVVPFVLGGEYALANLRAVGAVSGMRSRGNLARQIYDLPDGAQIEFRVID